ncbi:hypothetical protein SAMN04487969_102522 [Paenibacillus algorifonticola]|uniref:Uncharacterized protein n=1 Tax=Paenibacillus algorifonticola TaxID=684063 RepID=A0A1I2ALU4_9BACL|nr:hypothetical protein [Paenibacillus algorifonticola]SFE43923.1 hypothetical protein SAMN04487969_102522 [Paenibacillus algorifonticola]
MTFTFPEDTKKRAGAVRLTPDGQEYYVPTVLFMPDGETPVDFGGAQPPVDVVLQDNSDQIGGGTSYAPSDGNAVLTFSVRGTSTAREINFETADASGVYMACTAYSLTNPTIFGPTTTDGDDTAPTFWQVQVPAGWSFRASISAVSGGNVTAEGKAVIG